MGDRGQGTLPEPSMRPPNPTGMLCAEASRLCSIVESLWFLVTLRALGALGKRGAGAEGHKHCGWSHRPGRASRCMRGALSPRGSLQTWEKHTSKTPERGRPVPDATCPRTFVRIPFAQPLQPRRPWGCRNKAAPQRPASPLVQGAGLPTDRPSHLERSASRFSCQLPDRLRA